VFSLFRFLLSTFPSVALWGLDNNGNYKPFQGGSNGEDPTRPSTMSSSSSFSPSAVLNGIVNRVKTAFPSNTRDAKSIGDLIYAELETMENLVKEEKELFATEQLSEREKGKRLLFLFQKDLMPGINGMILESKNKRDALVINGCSRTAKMVSWAFVVGINVGMLFYILLFALSQDVHRQKAWGQSFALWFVVEVFVVSSLSVLMMNVLIPSLIMKDVGIIKKKLVTTVITFYQEMAQERLINQKNGTKPIRGLEEIEKKKGIFNSAEYLFVSNRLATIYSDLKLSKMILSFQTPWPKQSYQHVSDVSKKYDRKFSTVQRSLSIVVLFFLSGLLSVPISIQDMIVQLASTVAMGYTVLFHLRLYQIFPLLIVVPTIFLGVILHFMFRSNQAKKKMEETRLLNEMTELHDKNPNKKSNPSEDKTNGEEKEESNNNLTLYSVEGERKEPTIEFPVHKRRRHSLQQGISLAKRLNEFLEHRGQPTDKQKLQESDEDNDSGSNSLDSSLTPEDSDEEEGNRKNEVCEAYKIFQKIAADFDDLDDEEDEDDDDEGLFNLHLAVKKQRSPPKATSNTNIYELSIGHPNDEDRLRASKLVDHRPRRVVERTAVVKDNKEEGSDEEEDDDDDSLEGELHQEMIRRTVAGTQKAALSQSKLLSGRERRRNYQQTSIYEQSDDTKDHSHDKNSETGSDDDDDSDDSLQDDLNEMRKTVPHSSFFQSSKLLATTDRRRVYENKEKNQSEETISSKEKSNKRRKSSSFPFFDEADSLVTFEFPEESLLLAAAHLLATKNNVFESNEEKEEEYEDPDLSSIHLSTNTFHPKDDSSNSHEQYHDEGDDDHRSVPREIMKSRENQEDSALSSDVDNDEEDHDDKYSGNTHDTSKKSGGSVSSSSVTSQGGEEGEGDKESSSEESSASVSSFDSFAE
jgi:hypothetical protein